MRLRADQRWYLAGFLVWVAALITQRYCLKGFVILTAVAAVLFLRPSLAALLQRTRTSHGS
ncbi:hypothetical protein IT575_08360 [bacterium]|nr:hypothetical protein [bacterium]